MAESTATPLQLTAGVGFYSGNAITANTDLANNITSYNALAPIANLLYTINAAASNVTLSISAGTLANLKAIGANIAGNYCPALGDSVPSNVTVTIANTGYTGSITTAGTTYLGDGDFGKFAQAFGAAQGYISLTNNVILSAVNVNSDDYLGPTFSDMNNLISGDIAKVNLAFPAFGADLAACGDLFSLENIDMFGTPAALLNQLAVKGNMLNGSTPAVTAALKAQGLTDQDIADLVNLNVQSLFNPTGLTQNAFDTLQKLAYLALLNVSNTSNINNTGSLVNGLNNTFLPNGTVPVQNGSVVNGLTNALLPLGALPAQNGSLQEVLDILDCTLPNIATMADLLNPVNIFPTSYSSLTLPTPNGSVLIYDVNGDVNSAITPILNSGTLAPVGCDDLAKIIPPATAAANRALQIAFQQIKGITRTTAPKLAAILQ